MSTSAAAREEPANWHQVIQREVTRPDGLDRMLRRLAQRVEGAVVLLDRAGVPVHASPRLPRRAMEQASSHIARLVEGRVGATVANLENGTVYIQSTGHDADRALLLVARPGLLDHATLSLVADTARLVWLRWRLDDLGLRQEHVRQADVRIREAVLHLLMTGNVQASRRVASALGPKLGDHLRVYVVECQAGARDRSIAECERASGGRAWIVRCPVYTRHVIVLSPSGQGADGMEEPLRAYAARSKDVDIGSSQTVTLRDVPSAYEQGFHALAVARGSVQHYATYSPRQDLAALLRRRGHAWATSTLQPLLRYHPDRGQDPDAAELIATVRSWLGFAGGAARQLKIHRNTLLARLRHVEQLLGCDLGQIDTQSQLYLALGILDGPGNGTAMTLEGLLDAHEVRRWAHDQVVPLERGGLDHFLETLQVWLDNNAHMRATASVLGVSVPGARKRMTRIEAALERSLLASPSARYEMWFALQVYRS